MNNRFTITNIQRGIFVGKDEYTEPITSFSNKKACSNELIFHISGESTVFFNGKQLDIAKDRIRFLPQGDVHEYVVKRREPGECIDVFFDTDIPVSEEAFVVKVAQSATVSGLFKKLFSVWVAKNDGYYYECISLLYRIFAEMQKQNYIPPNQYDTIKPAIEYIMENFLKSKISVPFLAEKCGISEAYLKKLFVKKFGMSPIKYIIQLKINHACDLLRSGQYTVSNVSELCGYTCAQNISDIKMIVTESSLKYLKLSDKKRFEKKIDEWLSYIDDLFGIVKTDKSTNFFGGQVVRTSYQLLNTLGLSQDEVAKLLEETLDYYQKVRSLFLFRLHYLKQ